MIDVTILGAGASGLFAAHWLGKDLNVLIIDHNDTVGAKIRISGGGKCNLTNQDLSIEHYLTSDPKLANSVLESYDNIQLLEWVKKRGCNPIIRKKSQYFCPKSANQMVQILKPPFAKILLGHEILDVEKRADRFLIKTDKIEFESKTLLVATGGVSYKKIGASGIGYEIAKKFGHTIVPTQPALVGFTVQKEQFWFKELSGISLEATVEVGEKSFQDSILFAHRGISGPAILNASLYWQKGPVTLRFLEKIPRLQPHKQLSTQLPLPKRFTKAFLDSLGLKDIQVGRYSKETLSKVIASLKEYSFAPAGTFGYERAEVTKGGVALDALDGHLQSKNVPGLFFAGEVLDVTGELGGYNFQWAFSSGYVAAKGIDEYIGNH